MIICGKINFLSNGVHRKIEKELKRILRRNYVDYIMSMRKRYDK